MPMARRPRREPARLRQNRGGCNADTLPPPGEVARACLGTKGAFLAVITAALSLAPTLVSADMPAETRRVVPYAVACDRACLYAIADRYMAALITKDPTKLSVARDIRFSENQVMMPLGEGAWNTADALGPHFEFADVRTGQVGWMGQIVERGVPAVYGMRMKVRDGKITEVETNISRVGVTNSFTAADFAAYSVPPQAIAPLPPEKRRWRDRMISIADGYFDTLQLNDGTLFTQFTPDCSRRENAVWTASDPNPNATGPLARYGKMTCEQGFLNGTYRWDDALRERRYPMVDEELGIVLSTAFIDHSGVLETYRTNDGQTLDTNQKSPHSFAVMELFKIVDGKIRHAEATFFTAPYRTRNPWVPAPLWPEQ